MAETRRRKADLKKLTRYAGMVNIAEDLEREDLLKIAQRVMDDFETDYGSLDEWRKTNKKAVKAAKQVVEEKSYPWPNASNVKYPLLTTAAIHFNARAMPAILNGAKVVKGKVVGNDPDGEKEDRAERVGDHMSYQLLEESPGWEEDTDKLTVVLPIVGNVFRKTFYDPILTTNVSKIVWAENFVYHYKSSFDTATRHTECFSLFPQEIIEKQRYGLYLEDVDLQIDKAAEEEEPQDMLEQHARLDLDDDGYKEPYIVTVHKETQEIVRIVARYDIEEITVKYNGETGKVKDFEQQVEMEGQQIAFAQSQYDMMAQRNISQGIPPPLAPRLPELPTFDIDKAEVVYIEPVKYYTKYGFIPAFDGGGYDVGLGQLLESLGGSIDTGLNQLIDAGTLANLQGGFITRGMKIKGGKVRTGPNEWTRVDNQSGAKLRDSVMPFNYPGPNVVALNLLTFLIDAAKDISSVKDSTTGEMAGANESPTTYLTRVSEGLKVFSAIYKRVHRSLKEEFRKFYRLNRLYLEDEAYYTVLDDPRAIRREDYAEGVDVMPVSDPTIATTTQKNAKAQAIYQIGKDNHRYNQYEVEKAFLEAMDVEEIDTFLLKDEDMPEPPPDPAIFELQAKIEKMGAETEKIRAETVMTYNDIQASVAKLQQGFEELDIKRLAQTVEILSKVIAEQENYDLFQRVKNEGAGLQPGPVDGGGIPRLEEFTGNPKGEIPLGPGAGGTFPNP